VYSVNKIEVLDIWFNDLTIQSLNELILSQVLHQRKTIIAHHNLHSLYLFHTDPDFKQFFNLADYVFSDGMPLILWSKIKGWDVINKNRVTSLDFYQSLFDQLNAVSASIFYLGGTEGTALTAIQQLEKKYPQIRFDCYPGHFDLHGKENDTLLKRISMAKPNILFVGMGMPRQEKWILENLARLPNSVVLPCGAFFDYLAGEKKTPPRWLGMFCLEWLYRFCCEPKRLFSRYFLEPLYLIPIFLRDLTRATKPHH